jgi:hypothetical protein
MTKIYLDKILKNAEKIENWFKYEPSMCIECINCSRFRKDNKRIEIFTDIEMVLKCVKTEKFDEAYSKLYFKYKDICE